MNGPALRRGLRPPAPLLVALAGLALLAGSATPPALAQTTPSTRATTTSTTVTAITTTVPPATSAPTTSTTAPLPAFPLTPPSSAPGPGAPPADPPAPAPPVVDPGVEDASDEPPPRTPVPPRATPRVLTPADQAGARVLAELLSAAQRSADEAFAASQAANQLLAALEAEQGELQRAFEALRAEEAATAQRLVEQRQHMRSRAVAIYVSGPGEPVIPVGDDLHEYGRRLVLVEALHTADRRTFEEYLGAKAAAGDEVGEVVDRLEELNGRVVAARADAEAKAAVAAQRGLGGGGTGRAVVNGFAFPVAEPHSFASTFGAPRSGGRLHQGNDIFAPFGTPLAAAERGVVSKMGTNALGGIKLWITGESGTSYYYAHLAAFAPNVVDGTVVEAGEVVGFTGNTGNAITTPPHLHFEIHPSNGPAIDPFPVLKAADDATRRQAARLGP